eukprot:TRINITY_DN97_c0_g3_i6.p1 TRINITY_DN97_c0_g3~~TRINITY_DN97_c0_g3_i6.p1  ORF type:complete len:869 (+),score=219.48 TRINITY_DN97_c0_g3_i6:225-2831(+)
MISRLLCCISRKKYVTSPGEFCSEANSVGSYKTSASHGSLLSKASRASTGSKAKKVDPIAEALKNSTMPSSIIDARGNFMRNWDIASIFLLLFVAFFTPFESSFLEVSINIWFFVNRCIDVFFLVDMGINFFLSYYDKDKNHVVSHKQIVSHYFRTWFIVDFLSIVPFDMLEFVFPDSDIGKFKAVRMLRLFRLFKLLRVLKASRILNRLEANYGISYAKSQLGKFFFAVIMFAHWTACLWHFISDESGEESWIIFYEFDEDPPLLRYLASMYWSIMTVSTIGFGDIVPQNPTERFLACLVMFIGTAIYAYVVGSVCGILSSIDPAKTHFRQSMDQLNLYMSENSLPMTLQRSLRDFFKHCRQLYRDKYYQSLLEEMTPQLRLEVAAHCHGAWISKVWFFNAEGGNESQMFVPHIALKLQPVAFPPKENIIQMSEPTETMYIVQRGLVAQLGKVLGTGKFFGEDMILHGAKRHYQVTALTFVDLYRLTKKDMEEVLDTGLFPKTKKKIRKAAIRLSLRREFVKYAAVKRLLGPFTMPSGKVPKRLQLDPIGAAVRKKAVLGARKMDKSISAAPTSVDVIKSKFARNPGLVRQQSSDSLASSNDSNSKAEKFKSGARSLSIFLQANHFDKPQEELPDIIESDEEEESRQSSVSRNKNTVNQKRNDPETEDLFDPLDSNLPGVTATVTDTDSDGITSHTPIKSMKIVDNNVDSPLVLAGATFMDKRIGSERALLGDRDFRSSNSSMKYEVEDVSVDRDTLMEKHSNNNNSNNNNSNNNKNVTDIGSLSSQSNPSSPTSAKHHMTIVDENNNKNKNNAKVNKIEFSDSFKFGHSNKEKKQQQQKQQKQQKQIANNRKRARRHSAGVNAVGR